VVTNRTGVAVVAFRVVGDVLASPYLGADVVGAGVVVVAIHRVTDAHAGNAVIRDGAGIAVQAFPFSQGSMFAPGFARAEVFGAVVAVIAEVDEVTAHFGWFIGESVAIVVHPIAGLGRRVECVTI